MTATPTHPLRLRKLNRDKRLQLARLASEKFRCLDLRAIETAAYDRLSEILERDAHSTPKKELTVLEKYRYLATVEKIHLPYDLCFRENGERKFTRPDGVEVTREGGKTRSIRRPGDDEHELPRFSSWGAAHSFDPTRRTDTCYTAPQATVALKKPARLPGRHDLHKGEVTFKDNRGWKEREETGTKLSFDMIRSTFLSADVMPALIAYYVAAETRIVEERRLIAAAVKVLASCDLYGQVLDFWPEAAEIEDKLFDDVIPNAFSLVPLSDDDKAALCRNMASRGVASPICERRAA